MDFKLLGLLVLTVTVSSGCVSVFSAPGTTWRPADLEPATNFTSELSQLPPPKGRINVAVYGFKDQTGQYKQAPDSSFSTAVSQGGAAMLVKALRDSRWFDPVEREGLQDLLTERKLMRATEQPGEKNAASSINLPSLTPANLLIEGAVVGYDFNVSSGGEGAKYLGIGFSDQYRKDQVTVNLRAVDINNGRVLHSVTSTKTIFSRQVQPGVYRFVGYKDLLEAEAGYTFNEPVQLAVQEAIERALLGLIAEGVYAHSWLLANEQDMNHPLFRSLLAQPQNRPAPAAGVVALETARTPRANDNDSIIAHDPVPPPTVPELLSVRVAPPANSQARSSTAAPVRPLPAIPDAEAAVKSVVEKKRGAPPPAADATAESFHSTGRE